MGDVDAAVRMAAFEWPEQQTQIHDTALPTTSCLPAMSSKAGAFLCSAPRESSSPGHGGHAVERGSHKIREIGGNVVQYGSAHSRFIIVGKAFSCDSSLSRRSGRRRPIRRHGARHGNVDGDLNVIPPEPNAKPHHLASLAREWRLMER